MQVGPIIAPSAYRHGIDDADTLHAYRNAIRYTVGADDLDMAIGPDTSGALLEVGYIIADDSTVVIVHSMPARPKFLR